MNLSASLDDNKTSGAKKCSGQGKFAASDTDVLPNLFFLSRERERSFAGWQVSDIFCPLKYPTYTDSCFRLFCRDGDVKAA